MFDKGWRRAIFYQWNKNPAFRFLTLYFLSFWLQWNQDDLVEIDMKSRQQELQQQLSAIHRKNEDHTQTGKQYIDRTLKYSIIYLLWVLRRFQHCTGHIMTGSFMGRGNQYIQLVKVLYCKLLTIGKQLQTFPHKVWGLNC